jgi:hypothetical protein
MLYPNAVGESSKREPRRIFKRLSGKAAASEEARRYIPHV